MPKKTALSVLVAARKLITPRKKWTQGAFARSSSGTTIDIEDKSAVCWCALGALHWAGRDTDLKEWQRARVTLDSAVPRKSILTFNDRKGRKHRQVLAAFDRAIAKLRKEQRAA